MLWLKYKKPVKPTNKMTYILGARCSDGVVLVADRKITYDNNNIEYEDKLFTLHPAPIVWCSSGSTMLFQRFKEQSFLAAHKYKDAIEWLSYRDRLEKIANKLNRLDPNEHVLDVFVACNIEDTDGVKFATLYNIPANGSAHPVKKCMAIGSGEPYGSVFIKKYHCEQKSMKDIAELGYFIIRHIEENGLDKYVGLDGNIHPQIYYMPHQGEVTQATEEQLAAIRKKVDGWLSRYNIGIENLFSGNDP